MNQIIGTSFSLPQVTSCNWNHNVPKNRYSVHTLRTTNRLSSLSSHKVTYCCDVQNFSESETEYHSECHHQMLCKNSCKLFYSMEFCGNKGHTELNIAQHTAPLVTMQQFSHRQVPHSDGHPIHSTHIILS